MTRNLDGTKRVRPAAKEKTEAQKAAGRKRAEAARKDAAKLARIERLRKQGVII